MHGGTHRVNPSTLEAEAGGSLCLRPVWSTERVPGQPGLHRETLSPENKQTNKQNNQPYKQTKHGLKTPFILGFTSVGKEGVGKKGAEE